MSKFGSPFMAKSPLNEIKLKKRGRVAHEYFEGEGLEADPWIIKKETYEMEFHRVSGRNPIPEMITQVSMNGTATLTEDDFLEMSLASAEAVGMFKAVIEKDEANK